MTTLDPIVAGPGDTVHAGGSVRNTSQEVLRGLEIRLRLSRTPVGRLAELAAVAAGQSTTRDGDVVATLTPDPRDLAEGRQVRFDVSMDLDKADTLDQFGVYVISIEVLASHRDGFGRVAITRTFLPASGSRRSGGWKIAGSTAFGMTTGARRSSPSSWCFSRL